MKAAVINLRDALVNTNEFNRLRALRKEIDGNPSLRTALAEYEQNMQKLNSIDPNDSRASALMTRLREQHAGLERIPKTQEYLAAEQAFGTQFSNVVQSLHELIYMAIKG